MSNLTKRPTTLLSTVFPSLSHCFLLKLNPSRSFVFVCTAIRYGTMQCLMVTFYTNKCTHTHTHRPAGYRQTVNTNTLAIIHTHKHTHTHARARAHTHWHTNTHTHTDARTCTHTHRQTHTHTLTRARRHTQTHTLTLTHAHTRTGTHLHTLTRARRHTQTHTRAHWHIRTRTHTHTHTLTRALTHTHARAPTHMRTHWQSLQVQFSLSPSSTICINILVAEPNVAPQHPPPCHWTEHCACCIPFLFSLKIFVLLFSYLFGVLPNGLSVSHTWQHKSPFLFVEDITLCYKIDRQLKHYLFETQQYFILLFLTYVRQVSVVRPSSGRLYKKLKQVTCSAHSVHIKCTVGNYIKLNIIVMWK